MKLGGKPKCFCTKSFIQITLKKITIRLIYEKREREFYHITPNKSFNVI